MGMLVASFRVPYRGMPIIACYQFQAAKLRFFPETTKYFFFFLRNILEKSALLRINYLDGLHAKLYTPACCLCKEVGVGGCGA